MQFHQSAIMQVIAAGNLANIIFTLVAIQKDKTALWWSYIVCIHAPPKRRKVLTKPSITAERFLSPDRFPEGEEQWKYRGLSEILRSEGMDFVKYGHSLLIINRGDVTGNTFNYVN